MNKNQAVKLCKELDLDSTKLVSIGDGHFTFSETILVTVALATAWLGKFNTENRKPKARHIDKMAYDIENGSWHVTHQGIAFREDGIMADGQNRLKAIVMSGKSAKIRVFLGLTKESMWAIDGNSPRTALDKMVLAGKKTTANRLSALKFLVGGIRGESDLSPEQLSLKEEEFQEELSFCFNHIPQKIRVGVTAAVRGAIMRCYFFHKNNSAKITKLEKFCDWICTGQNISSAMITKLRDNLSRQGYGGEGRKDLYSYTEKVLNHYLNGEEKSRLKPHPRIELFPFPNEMELGEEI